MDESRVKPHAALVRYLCGAAATTVAAKAEHEASRQ